MQPSCRIRAISALAAFDDEAMRLASEDRGSEINLALRARLIGALHSCFTNSKKVSAIERTALIELVAQAGTLEQALAAERARAACGLAAVRRAQMLYYPARRAEKGFRIVA